MGDVDDFRKDLERWVKVKVKKAGKFWQKKGIKEKIAEVLSAKAPAVAEALMDLAHDVVADVLLEVFVELNGKLSDSEIKAIRERAKRLDARLRERTTARLLDLIDKIF